MYTTLKNGVAAALLLVVVPQRFGRPVREVRRTLAGPDGHRRDRRRDRLPALLHRPGLASAPSAAFIQKTLFVWVAMLAVPFLGERLGWIQIVALVVLAVGQFLVLPPQGVAWGTGETMILVATLCWAAEVVVVRRYLRTTATPIVAAGRLGIGLVVLVGFVLFSGQAERDPGPRRERLGLGAAHRPGPRRLRRGLVRRTPPGAGDRRHERPRPRRAHHGRPARRWQGRRAVPATRCRLSPDRRGRRADRVFGIRAGGWSGAARTRRIRCPRRCLRRASSLPDGTRAAPVRPVCLRPEPPGLLRPR